MQQFEIHNKCIVCNSDQLVDMKGYERAYLCNCNACGMVFARRIPTDNELLTYYKNYGVNNYLSPLTIKRYNELLDKFEPYRKTNKLLDVGCGIGFFLLEAKKRGWEVYGTELSHDSAQVCTEKGIKIHEGTISTSNFGDQSFDIITSFEVIEHIYNPQTELIEFNKLLRSGGLVYITTPNFNSLLRNRLGPKYNVIAYPEHLAYFTPKTLKKLFKDFGFSRLHLHTTGISITRLKTSQGKSKQAIISAKSDDEKIRTKVENKWYLSLIKNLINFSLSLFGKGDTLKGWFIKS